VASFRVTGHFRLLQVNTPIEGVASTIITYMYYTYVGRGLAHCPKATPYLLLTDRGTNELLVDIHVEEKNRR